MKFSVVVYSSPYSSEAARTALQFSKAVLLQGHEIYRLFFFGDGAHNANRLTVTPQDEINIQQEWNSFITQNDIDAVICVTSALRRGVLDVETAKRHGKDGASMLDGFEISGLGQLVDAVTNSDRIINFG